MIITNNDITMLNNTAVALGAFDGVHIAHGVLINNAVTYAKEKGINSCVFTFDVNPKDSKLITTNRERQDIFELMGADILFLKQFDDSLKNLEPTEFLEEYLKNCRYICVGFNFKFGKDRKGNTKDIETFCKTNGIDFDIVDAVKYKGEIVSSSLIREYILNSDFKSAKEMLGRNYFVTGVVEKGDKIGITLGFPTANIVPDSIIAGEGVYLTYTTVDGKRYKSVTNVGGKPTIRGGVNRVETHIIDYSGDAYGKEIKVEFIKKIRDIIKFENTDSLKSQLKNDVNIAKTELL
ncbi:MAG: bifunctional riboflavin kinase/FAD synthetase [Clostridia bacterium]|nr:bifunctional riboflavin kinase/FAD synthetase [Clostridia bacterium]